MEVNLENVIARYVPLIVYIIISVVWIMIFAIAGIVFRNSVLSIFLSILWVVVYIPLIVYYISRGETGKAWSVVVFTFITTLIYLVYVTTWLLAELARITVR
ncbi:Hypothetical protein POVR1_LOCUS455 [uncultured virus]|nr:Hypothetical protein POVR1_LOCUS455 [uncultured virus]